MQRRAQQAGRRLFCWQRQQRQRGWPPGEGGSSKAFVLHHWSFERRREARAARRSGVCVCSGGFTFHVTRFSTSETQTIITWPGAAVRFSRAANEESLFNTLN
jgi:hypothetical protein